ncbi:hypothetical protein TCAL_05343 [Tigriopus californicus]|uniref:Carboxylesterase type B domain-containing protein n=1 Tax=Tigriopus californicus TaxID=6832 RepID=A0A553PFM9_TIGCA|nr:venom carboxylesterase-6-like [Tigriopus californicus]TRY76473.1 hypothetical protein TCAL_05343 [Tigriopus californicus]|eukprot:TCALIF_05343-PA protein Name:"Similar to Venom carboxylesterase-6 (Apis mellifera)" AED:0.06 eAED:0.06 QI:233/1/0.66/1/1/1/3/0/610
MRIYWINGLVILLQSLDVFGLEVTTTLGVIKGSQRQTKANKIDYVAFTSIPYAQAPVGSLRFLPPQPLDKFADVVDGSKTEFPICPQLTWPTHEGLQVLPVKGQEDCLYLNVFVPKSAIKANKKLPVMVFIHGGAFIVGSGGLETASPEPFLETEEVVFVTFNYRLGPLGFLSTEDEFLPGNNGLKDQIMALKWIQAHISDFNGNPDSVTLMGSSAGGTSVMMLMISEAATGLFHQGISQSGPLLNNPSTYLGESPAYFASSLIEAVNCDGSLPTKEVLKCLQALDVMDIVEHSNMFERFFITPNPWKPVLDSNYTKQPILKEDPRVLMLSGKFNQMPLIIGWDKDEGSLFMPQFLNNPERVNEVNENFDVLGPILLLGGDEHSTLDEDSNTANIIKSHYMDTFSGGLDMEKLPEMIRMFSHARYIGPIHSDAAILLTTARKPVYLYEFAYRGAHTFTDVLLRNDQRSMPDMGVCHCDENYLLFNKPGSELPSQDRAMSKRLVGMWVNFAKSGIPHSDWKPLGYDKANNDPEYAVLDDKPVRMKYDARFKKDMTFMESMFGLMHSYRFFDFAKHPALQNLLKAQEEEAIKDGDGVTDEVGNIFGDSHDEL